MGGEIASGGLLVEFPFGERFGIPLAMTAVGEIPLDTGCR